MDQRIEADDRLRFTEHGARRFERALVADELAHIEAYAEQALGSRRPGICVAPGALPPQLLDASSSLTLIATEVLGDGARPVRAVLFDKTAARNWAIGWHQDRTIVVRERRNVEGYGPWTIKGGLVQVEPPFRVTANMVTLRAHADGCDAENAPLLIAPGSHRLGRVPVESVDEVVSALGVRACLARRGDIWLYSTAILHASEAARNPRRRRVLQVDYANLPLDGGLEWCALA